MDNTELIKSLSRVTPSKIVFLVIDGLGGLPHPETGKTELETANTPNFDKLAAGSICGLADPVGPGITPGSAPGHLAIFGYDPIETIVGRGVLAAFGTGFDLKPDDVAARGNFCSVDESGLVTDRRAGRISSDKSTELCRLLDGQTIDSVEIFVRPVKDHRFLVVFRGQGLSPDVNSSDPQQTGVVPLEIKPENPGAGKLAALANKFTEFAGKTLAGHHPANMVLLRGFSKWEPLPTLNDIYKLTPAAIASYPMYRGLAKLIGMDIVETGTGVDDVFKSLSDNYTKYDFFFLHIKKLDSAGEDGNFEGKVAAIEEVDGLLPKLTGLQPDVIVVTGDHSTPAVLEAHSWHPVPVLISSRWCRTDSVSEFSESAFVSGGLGRLPSTRIMPLAMANALKLIKYGA
ncbi:MAG: 2,3-bisphosphoglycerate-independent phosphoglycerate mutase [Dehalococcoidales bacterium]